VESALNELGEAGPDDPAAVELAGQLARAHMLRGDLPQAVSFADRALSSARNLGLVPVATDALITRGAARVQMGEQAAGIEDLKEAIAQCSAHDLLGLELRARNNMAWGLVPDDPRRTVETARTGFDIGRQKGIRDMAVQLASVALPAAVETGEWDWALATLSDLEAEPMSPAHRLDIAATHAILRALRGTPDPGKPVKQLGPIPPDTDPQLRALADLAHAWIAFARGRYAGATDLAFQAAEASVSFNRHAALVLAGRAAIWERNAKNLDRALAKLRAEPMPGRSATARVTALAAGADAMSGKLKGARAGYKAAIAAWRELALPLPLLLTLLERETLVQATAAGASEARNLIDRLGARGLTRLTEGRAR
jgi:tetratricopeptide (TPR) repeat protein